MSGSPDAHKHETGKPDTVSDPRLDDGDSTDWTGEGGATEEGPATDTDESD